MKMVSIVTGVLLAAGSAAGQCSSKVAESGCSYDKTAEGAAMTVALQEPTKNLVETAVDAGSFTTLVAAVQAAGLVDALSGDGPLTVFAPTDEAFAALPEGTVENLLLPENVDTLRSILLYHVVAGDVRAADVTGLDFASSLNGQRIDIDAGANGVRVDNANVVTADILTTNGTIHVIDRVIMPSTDDIIDTAMAAGSFGTLATAIKTAGLVEALKGDGPFTVFAPTDEAFGKLPAGTVERLLTPEGRDDLKNILKFHVVSGRVYSDQALSAGEAETLMGNAITITESEGSVLINGARVVSADIDTSNGVIHVIDTVLLPE